jgi:hypothetical protein
MFNAELMFQPYCYSVNQEFTQHSDWSKNADHMADHYADPQVKATATFLTFSYS